MRPRLFMLLALFGVAGVLPAKTFEGSIRYAVTTQRGDHGALTLTIAGRRLRGDMTVGGHEGVTLVDFAKRTITVLMPANHSYRVLPLSDLAASGTRESAPSIKPLPDASTRIAGYPADAWEERNQGRTVRLWLTNALGRGFSTLAGGSSPVQIPASLLKAGGVLLKLADGKGVSLEATDVEPGHVPASTFAIPEGYTVMDDGMGAGAGSSSAMQNALQNLSPQQRAMVQQMMRQQGAGQ